MTLVNCLVLAGAAIYLQNINVPVPGANISALTAASKELGVDDLWTFNTSVVLDHVFSCVAASCQDPNLGDGNCSFLISPSSISTRDLNTSASDLDLYLRGVALDLIGAICQDSTGLLDNQIPNPDISGPGVSIDRFLWSTSALTPIL